MDLAGIIADQRFTPVRFSEGYDVGEVDAFLDRAASAAASPDPRDAAVLRAELPSIHFAPVRMSEGYDMQEVDDFLDDVLAPALAELVPDSGSGPIDCAVAADLLTRTTPALARFGLLTPLFTRESVDATTADAVRALTGGGDEGFRRRAAIGILESAHLVPHRGLGQGYVQSDVEQRFARVLALLRLR